MPHRPSPGRLIILWIFWEIVLWNLWSKQSSLNPQSTNRYLNSLCQGQFLSCDQKPVSVFVTAPWKEEVWRAWRKASTGDWHPSTPLAAPVLTTQCHAGGADLENETRGVKWSQKSKGQKNQWLWKYILSCHGCLAGTQEGGGERRLQEPRGPRPL